MARKERVKAIRYTYHLAGPDGPATFDELPGFTNDPAVLNMYENEVQRHLVLYLAEQEGEPVLDHPSAYMVEVVGLNTRPYRKRTTIPLYAITYQVKTPAEVIAYQVHSIRTARGRLLRDTGASRRLNDDQAEAMLTLGEDVAAA